MQKPQALMEMHQEKLKEEKKQQQQQQRKTSSGDDKETLKTEKGAQRGGPPSWCQGTHAD